MLSYIVLAFSHFAAEESGGGLLSVNGGLAFWMVVTFILLLFILKRFAWKPILSALDEREKSIRDSLELAEKTKEESKQLLEENKAHLQKADEEARKIVNQSREFAEKMKSQIIEESKIQAQKLIADASNEIDRKKQEAFNELKNQVAEISIIAAEKILKQNIDNEKNKVIVNNYLDEISKN